MEEATCIVWDVGGEKQPDRFEETVPKKAAKSYITKNPELREYGTVVVWSKWNHNLYKYRYNKLVGKVVRDRDNNVSGFKCKWAK